MAKKEATPKNVLERTYTIPLRREFQKVPGWRKTPKAVRATKQFLVKHMKSDNVKLGSALNQKLWQHGIRNPPHHVKVSVTKDDKGEVKAELFGVKIKELSKEEIKKKEMREKEKIEQKKEEIQAKEEQIKGEELEGTSEAELEKKKKSVEEEKEEIEEKKE